MDVEAWVGWVESAISEPVCLLVSMAEIVCATIHCFLPSGNPGFQNTIG